MSFGLMVVLLQKFMILSIASDLDFHQSIRSCFASPIRYDFSVSLASASSCLNNILYSALEVNILYGSSTPLVTRSSISTPMYDSSLFIVNTLSPVHLRAALMPATIPCPPASSYPVVPFTCPAKNNPLIILDSRLCFNCVGSK